MGNLKEDIQRLKHVMTLVVWALNELVIVSQASILFAQFHSTKVV